MMGIREDMKSVFGDLTFMDHEELQERSVKDQLMKLYLEGVEAGADAYKAGWEAGVADMVARANDRIIEDERGDRQ